MILNDAEDMAVGFLWVVKIADAKVHFSKMYFSVWEQIQFHFIQFCISETNA